MDLINDTFGWINQQERLFQQLSKSYSPLFFRHTPSDYLFILSVLSDIKLKLKAYSHSKEEIALNTNSN